MRYGLSRWLRTNLPFFRSLFLIGAGAFFAASSYEPGRSYGAGDGRESTYSRGADVNPWAFSLGIVLIFTGIMARPRRD